MGSGCLNVAPRNRWICPSLGGARSLWAKQHHGLPSVAALFHVKHRAGAALGRRDHRTIVAACRTCSPGNDVSRETSFLGELDPPPISADTRVSPRTAPTPALFPAVLWVLSVATPAYLGTKGGRPSSSRAVPHESQVRAAAGACSRTSGPNARAACGDLVLPNFGIAPGTADLSIRIHRMVEHVPADSRTIRRFGGAARWFTLLQSPRLSPSGSTAKQAQQAGGA